MRNFLPIKVPKNPLIIIAKTNGAYDAKENPKIPKTMLFIKCWKVIIAPWVATWLTGGSFILLTTATIIKPEAPNNIDIIETKKPMGNNNLLLIVGTAPNTDHKIKKAIPNFK